MTLKKLFSAGIAACAIAAANFASATVVTVGAAQNSIGGGWSFDSGIHLDKGQEFSVNVDPNEEWNFAYGWNGYWYNANGMVNGWTMNVPNPDGSNFVAQWASLIAQIGTDTAGAGDFFSVGTSFSGVANATGNLNFYFVDSDAWNNVGSVNANVDVKVPEPASLALLAAGLLGVVVSRKKKN